MISRFVQYMENYIEMLTMGQDEYLIAIADIDRQSAESFLNHQGEGRAYEAAWFDRNDYSKAVILRNRIDSSRVVLLSDDSVKSIDSLKDFVEYPAIPEDFRILWVCLENTFEQKLEDRGKRILEVVLENQRISIEDLLQFLGACMTKKGFFSTDKIKKNLYRLDIWTIKEESPTKQYIKKVIRNSDPLAVEKKLMNGITESVVSFPSGVTKKIINHLSSNNFREVYRTVAYEEVKEVFKSSRQQNSDNTQERQEEPKYIHSYEYAIEEQSGESMEDLENWLREKEQKELLEEHFQQYQYPPKKEITDEFQDLTMRAEQLSLPEEKRKFLTERLGRLKTLCLEAIEQGKLYTPVYLYHYAESQRKFVRCYMELLGICVSNSRIAQMCVGTGFLNQLQNLFCKRENNEIKMPFYHPMAGFYYLKLQRMYEENRNFLNGHQSLFREITIKALMNKEMIEFPVRYMLMDKELFQLDYASLQNQTNHILFTSIKDYGANSWVNIRLVNEDLMDYIERQKYLSEVRVTIVDINDISEIMFIIERLRKLPSSTKCMVHKVILNVVSRKDEDLKQQLQESMEMDLEYPQVLFKFTKDLYMQGEEYDLECIIRDSDLLFLADSNILYQKPKLAQWKGDSNWLQIGFEKLDTEKLLIQKSYEQGNVLEVLWDSIHHMELEEEVRMVCWNTRELKPSLLNQIRLSVRETPRLTVVMLSSNPQLLQHIYHLPGFQVRKKVMSGQEMLLVNFHQGSVRKYLQRGGNPAVTMELKPFLEEILGVHDLEQIIQYEEGDEKEEPYLTVCWEKGRFIFRCQVFVKEEAEEKESGERSSHYEQLAEDIIALSGYSTIFKNKLITMLYEKADTYGAVLMVDHMRRIGIRKDGWEYCEKLSQQDQKKPVDIADILAFQNMMEFLRSQKSIDEYSVNYFRSLFRKEMLEGCLHANRSLGFLEEKLVKKMEDLYTKIGEKNGERSTK